LILLSLEKYRNHLQVVINVVTKFMFRELFVIFQINQILKQMQNFVLMQIYDQILLG
jgi:hypothetical protein